MLQRWFEYPRHRRVRVMVFAAVTAVSLMVFLVLAYGGGDVGGLWNAAETLPLFLGVAALGMWYAAETLWRQSRVMALAAVLALAAGLILRLLALPYVSLDYTNFLSHWVQEFREQGLAAFHANSSNYNVLYQYILYVISLLPVSDLLLIKLVSVMGDMLLAVTGMRLVRHICPDRPAPATLALSLLWLVPTYWLNSAQWAQCDSLYGALCLLALLYILKNRPTASVVAGSLAFAFKLQAIFFLPMFVIFLIMRRVQWYHAIYFPAVMVATSLPAAFLGMPLWDIFGVYVGQTKIYAVYLNLNAASWYGLLPRELLKEAETNAALREPYFRAGVLMAFAAMLALWGLAYGKRKKLDDSMLVMFAAAMTLLIPFLLPGMHDRYYYLPEIFTLLAAVLCWKRFPLAVMTWLGSYGGYHAYLRRSYFLQGGVFSGMQASAFCMLVAVLLGIAFLALSLRSRQRKG